MPSVVRLAAGAVALLGGVLVPSLPASASYTVWSCRGPDGAPLVNSVWTASAAADECLAGGGLRATLTGRSAARGTTSGFTLAVPSDVGVERVRLWATASTAATTAGTLSAGVFTRGSLGAERRYGVESDAGAQQTGTDDDPVATANLVTLGGGEIDGLALQARCTAGLLVPECTTSGEPAAQARLYRSAIDVADAAAPTVAGLTGSAFAAGSRSGTVEVAADTADAGGGVLTRTLLVDGAPVATQAGTGTCAAPFTTFKPCPAGLRATFSLDTRALADGRHTVTVRATDAGGLTGEASAPIVVANAVPAAPVAPAAAASAAPVAAGPAPVRIALPKRIALPHRGAITGRVVAADGSGVAGAAVQLLTKGLGQGDERLRAAGTVVTAADGTFPIATGGDSRVVLALVDGVIAQQVELVRPLRVRAAGPRGAVPYRAAFALTGRLAGAGAASGGKRVEVQAIAGGKWRTVAKIAARDSGSLRWRYRLRNTTRPSDYRFRFRVPKVAGQPWRATTSRPVVVKVRPS